MTARSGVFRLTKEKFMNREIEIYKQTQELCKLLMSHDNFYSDFPVRHDSKGRAATYWKNACEIQEFMNGHEMSDVVTVWEEMCGYTYEILTDREALVVLGTGSSVYVRSGKNGNEDGYKEIKDPVDFMATCYGHCTVYKKVKL